MSPREESSAATQAPVAARRSLLAVLYDPDWFPFVGVLLLPVLISLPFGGTRQATFFLHTAIYLGVLKWLGRVVVTRHALERRGPLLFPADLFFGLALGCLWFYLRNLVAHFCPATYSLRELAVLPVLVGAIQTVGGLACLRVLFRERASPGPKRDRDVLGLIGPYLPYALLLLVALWNVSRVLNVQSSDPLIHAWIGRLYQEEGFTARPLPDEQPLVYPAGFGAINATAIALSPLNIVQSVNLQHILWLITALFLVPASIRMLYPRSPGELQVLPLFLVSVLPIYYLKGGFFYSGCQRQAAPAFLLALCFLPATLNIHRLGPWCVATGLMAVLGAVSVALNPACAPFVAVALLISLATSSWRGSEQLAVRKWTIVAIQGTLTALAAVLIVGLDPYYARKTEYAIATDLEIREELRDPVFSTRRAAEAALSLNPLSLTPLAGLPEGDEEISLVPLVGWPERALTWVTLLLAAWSSWSICRPRRMADAIALGLGWLFTTGWLLWLVGRPLLLFLAEGVSRTRWDTILLRIYLRFILNRCELLLLFVFLTAGLVILLQQLATAARFQPVRTGIIVVLMTVSVVLFAMRIVTDDRYDLHHIKVPINPAWAVSDDDLRLVAWIDEHVQPNERIAPQAYTMQSGPRKIERHLYPAGGAVALVLYGKHRNYRFFWPTEREGIYEEYLKNVKESLNVEWCRANGIRYFYVTAGSDDNNRSLHKAIGEGVLRLKHREGKSGLYEIAVQ